MRLITVVVMAAATALSGCAMDMYRPMIDYDGSNKTQAEYESDLAECQGYARQINPAGQAFAGLLAGAVMGAAMGAVIGDTSGWAEAGAKGGAIGGATGGAANGAQTQVDIIRRCMVGRGYSVLN